MASNQAGVYRGGNTSGTTGTGVTGTGTSSDRNAAAGTLRNTTGTAGTGVVSAERGEPICDQKYYTKVGLSNSVLQLVGPSIQCCRPYKDTSQFMC